FSCLPISSSTPCLCLPACPLLNVALVFHSVHSQSSHLPCTTERSCNVARYQVRPVSSTMSTVFGSSRRTEPVARVGLPSFNAVEGYRSTPRPRWATDNKGSSHEPGTVVQADSRRHRLQKASTFAYPSPPGSIIRDIHADYLRNAPHATWRVRQPYLDSSTCSSSSSFARLAFPVSRALPMLIAILFAQTCPATGVALRMKKTDGDKLDLDLWIVCIFKPEWRLPSLRQPAEDGHLSVRTPRFNVPNALLWSDDKATVVGHLPPASDLPSALSIPLDVVASLVLGA
ncbi:hypothetical protein FB45DRAFT_1131135, partial [Roridomyces roridus]